MIISTFQLTIKLVRTLCLFSIFFKISKGLAMSTMFDKIECLGKSNLFCILIIVSTLNWLINLPSKVTDNCFGEDQQFLNSLWKIFNQINEVFGNGNIFNSIWNSGMEYIMIVIFCKRQFTLNSSFFFALSLLCKNLHLPWIQNFRGLEIVKEDNSFHFELINLFSIFFTIYGETKFSKDHMHFTKRRLANCIVGSEVVSIALTLKGLLVGKVLSTLNQHSGSFEFNQIQCFYLRVVIFSFLSLSHILSLRNLGLTKKVIFKFYIFSRIFQSIKEFVENFSELNRFRKMTRSLNQSMSSPTEKEIEDLSDQLCIICRDEITQNSSKKLPCGHIFHISCLQNWMIRQYCCPICLTTISSRSNDPLKGINKIDFEINKMKTDLVSLTIGCRGENQKKCFKQKLDFRKLSLPSLEPDLVSLLFSKNTRPSFSDINLGNFEKIQYLSIFEKLFKVKLFLVENFIHFSNLKPIFEISKGQFIYDSNIWNKSQGLDTVSNLKKITDLVHEFTS